MVIPPRILGPDEFLKEAEKGGIILDVRAPSEYEEGHITGARSWPLFSDVERAEIGTLYKQKSKELAVEKGFEIIGPKMVEMARHANELYLSTGTNRPLLIHCWRGGMRSQSVAWLLRIYGVPAILLDGGYKAYRSFARSQFDKPLNLAVLGGLTGSAKTDVINDLRKLEGEKVLDLEGMARHFGSAFGNLEQHKQPTSKQFSNDLYARLRELDAWGDCPRPIWVENESRTIGKVNLPEPFYGQIINSTCLEMLRTEEDRVGHLVNMYGDIDVSLLAGAFKKITPKLGGQHAATALDALEKGDLATAARIALVYYDKTYSHGLTKRGEVNRISVDCKGLAPSECAVHLSEFLSNYIKEKDV